MFPPGFFAADYFAPGYWPEATSAVPGEVAANIFAGATLAAVGAVSVRAIEAPSFGSGGRFVAPRRILPRSVPQFQSIHADGAAAISGCASTGASASGAALLGAALAGGSVVAGTAVARVNFTRRDNQFWLLAA